LPPTGDGANSQWVAFGCKGESWSSQQGCRHPSAFPRTQVKIPVVSVSKADGARMRAQPGDTTIKLSAGSGP
jgi:hypothetical protein